MTAEKTLAGKVALITGAARRSGRATAIQLAADGCAVAINTRRSKDEADAVKAEIEKNGGKANVYLYDITQEDAVADMFKAIENDLDGVDILVNNAADRARIPTLELDFAEWKRIIDIILDGAFLCTRAALPHMLKNKWGRIINISGDGNLAAFTERAHVHAGKGGLEAMTRTLSSEFCDQGITVNTVSPGRIGGERPKSAGPKPKNADITPPVGYEGEPDDIANAIRFLCQPASHYITGQAFRINGGMVLT
ncbi:MAG: SDR family oxidoreductase [Rhodospirillaceae bacterium]|jgi:3-oxoacyl-[acyl-carrier protein] reductase